MSIKPPYVFLKRSTESDMQAAVPPDAIYSPMQPIHSSLKLPSTSPHLKIKRRNYWLLCELVAYDVMLCDYQRTLYLAENKMGCRDVRLFFGVITAPGRLLGNTK